MKWGLKSGGLLCMAAVIATASGVWENHYESANMAGQEQIDAGIWAKEHNIVMSQSRPPLIEPVMEAGTLINGNFELGKNEWGEVEGWDITFSGAKEPGSEGGSYGLSEEKNNIQNTTRKLALYNGSNQSVDFSMKQSVERYPSGEYTVALVFEGDSEIGDSQTKLIVNSKEVELGSLEGWGGWKQVFVSGITVPDGGTIDIEIKGQMAAKQWMDIDDIEIIPSDRFKAREFKGLQPVQEQPAVHQELMNGEFEEMENEGGIPGWHITFKDWGQGKKRAAFKITEESDNKNSTRKLAVGNSTGDKNDFSVRQMVKAPAAGNYIVTCEAEAGPQNTGSELYLKANHAIAEYGTFLGWNHWKQMATEPFYVAAGEIIDIEIKGTLASEGWFDLDHVKLIPADQYIPAENAVNIMETVPEYEAVNTIKNGAFSEGICYDVKNYPNGYLPGWILPETDFSVWKILTYQGTFEVNNISTDQKPAEYTIKQEVYLEPGEYTLDAYTGWIWNDANPDGVCMRVAEPDGTLIAERYWNPGWGQIASDSFRISEKMKVTVSFTFQLMPGETASLQNVELRSYPADIKWISANQIGGKSEKKDTVAVKLKFSRSVFDLQAEDFKVEGAEVDRLENHQGGNYQLFLKNITADNQEKLTIAVDHPEGSRISPKKKRVMVYRDFEEIGSNMTNWDFTEDINWDMEEYPDGYLSGWLLPEIDWDIWRYHATAGEFTLNNISKNEKKEYFTLKQLVKLEPGRYLLEGYTGWEWDAQNPEGVHLIIRDKNKILASGSGSPGIGRLYTTPFEVEKDTTVYVEAQFGLSAGKSLGLSYLRIVPENTVNWIQAEQEGGESDTVDTKAVRMLFDKETVGLDIDDISIKGAKASSLTMINESEYLLELSEIEADNGETITININNPEGIQIYPSSKQVVVYRCAAADPGEGNSGSVVNGDFSAGVDWNDGGSLKGWNIQSEMDYDVSKYTDWKLKASNITDTGKNLTLSQNVFLVPGTYQLSADLTSLWVDGSETAEVVLSAAGITEDRAGGMTGWTDTRQLKTPQFTLDTAGEVTIQVSFELPPQSNGFIDNVKIVKLGKRLKATPANAALSKETPSNATLSNSVPSGTVPEKRQEADYLEVTEIEIPVGRKKLFDEEENV